MKICITTDEVSSDCDTAMDLIRSWGLDAIDIRGIGDGRYPDVSEYWRTRVPQLVKEYGLRVIALSPGLFKFYYPDPPATMWFSRPGDARQFELEQKAQARLERHVKTILPASIEAAKQLGAKMILCFSFHRQEEGPHPEGAVQVLRHAAEQCEAAGLQLNIELQDWSTRGADLVRQVNHPNLGISWTPASAFAAGEHTAVPDGYANLKQWIRHLHFKNVSIDPNGRPPIDPEGKIDTTGKYKWSLEGEVDWAQQVRLLKQDGYDGYISLEPHSRPQIGAAMWSLDRLKTLIAEA